MTEHEDYRAAMVSRYWDYQKRVFSQTDGILERPFASDGRPPVFLPSEAWRNVLIPPDLSPSDVENLLALVPKPDRHRWYRSMSSSQALAQSVFGNLAVGDLLHSLASLQADEGALLFGNAELLSANFAMEHKVRHLGEPRPTGLDGYVAGNHQVAIECKLMEPGIGPCSRPNLTLRDSNYLSERCSGDYSVQDARRTRCPLTEVGVRYWSFVPRLFRWRNDVDLNPCPLNENYQLVRNILAVCTDGESTISLGTGHAVLIHDARNPAFRDGGKGLTAYLNTRSALLDPTQLRRCSWQRLVRHLREQALLPWLTEQLSLKYGL